MTNKNLVIAVDHGNSQCKTVHTVFPTGVVEISTEPAFKDNILELDEKYYSLVPKRFELKADKTEDQKFYLLTLVAIAKEMKMQGITSANLYLAVGLPPARFGAEKANFKKYMMQKREVNFKFEGIYYHIHIDKVGVYPQCYSAIVGNIKDYKQKRYIVDIGSWTVDVIAVQNFTYIEADCITLNQGIIKCIRDVNRECIRQFNYQIDEYDIQQVMTTGESTLPDKVINIVKKSIVSYVDSIYKTLLENGINPEIDRITFVGGGATLMKRYGNIESSNISFNLDINANAKGYEILMKKSLSR